MARLCRVARLEHPIALFEAGGEALRLVPALDEPDARTAAWALAQAGVESVAFWRWLDTLVPVRRWAASPSAASAWVHALSAVPAPLPRTLTAAA